MLQTPSNNKFGVKNPSLGATDFYGKLNNSKTRLTAFILNTRSKNAIKLRQTGAG